MARPAPTRPLLLLVVIFAACGNPSGPDAHGDCDLVVRIEDVLYALQADEQVSAGFTPGAPYASVAGRKDCTDFVADGLPVSGVLADGESTFLPAGTPLYPATGFEVTDRLVAQWNGDWVFVVEKVLH